MGEEKGLAFFRKLAASKPQIRTGHTLLAELLSSGRCRSRLDLQPQHAKMMARGRAGEVEGAEPDLRAPNAVGVALRAPPECALLFADFMLSSRAEAPQSADRVPASRPSTRRSTNFPSR
jgi:iron(III) transport system substrate-binding protein